MDCPAKQLSHQSFPRKFLSQAHSSLSIWMLCCGLVALLALILCEVLFLPMKKGTVRGKTHQDEQG